MSEGCMVGSRNMVTTIFATKNIPIHLHTEKIFQKLEKSIIFILFLYYHFITNPFKLNNMLPYILLVDDDPEDCNSFANELEKQIAFATVATVNDGPQLLTFLSERDWDELPSIIL